METTESKAISSLSVYMYFADISIVNSGVREAYAHVYCLVTRSLRKCYLQFFCQLMFLISDMRL